VPTKKALLHNAANDAFCASLLSLPLDVVPPSSTAS